MSHPAAHGNAPHGVPPSPERFFQVINSFHNVAVMKAAIELGVFTAIGQGHNTVEKAAKLLKVNPRGARRAAKLARRDKNDSGVRA